MSVNALFAMVLVLAASLFSYSPEGLKAVRVPKGAAPQIDGLMADDEWKGAVSYPLSAGGRVMLRHDDDHLYLLIQGSSNGFAQVYLAGPDQARVLHASAALGELSYRPTSSGKWELETKYDWQLRRFAERSTEEKQTYLGARGWLANTINMGQVREFKIARSALVGKKIGVVYISTTDGKLTGSFWPSSLADDTVKPELLRGEPSALTFDLEQWAALEFTK